MATTKGQRRRNARLLTADPANARFIVARHLRDPRTGAAFAVGTDVTELFRDNPNLRSLVKRGVLVGEPGVDHRRIPPKGLAKGSAPARTGSAFQPDPKIAKALSKAPEAPAKAPAADPDLVPAAEPNPHLEALRRLNKRHSEGTIRAALDDAGIDYAPHHDKEELLALAGRALKD